VFATGERLLGAEGVVRELIPRTIAEVLTGDDGDGAVELEHFARTIDHALRTASS
jgi:hypothetical protein